MRIKPRTGSLLLIGLTLSVCLAAAPSAVGQTAGAFSRRGFGPRGISMGNAQVADVFGLGSPWYNPALAPYYSDQSIEASHTFLSQDRGLEYVQFLVPMPPRAGVAAGLIHAGVSDIDGRDASGYHTQDYSTDELAGYLAFGSRIGRPASVGIAFRFYRADLLPDLDPATSIGLAFGATYRLRKVWSFGVAIDDLLSRYEWDTSAVFGSSGRKTTDQFPVRLRIGTSYRVLEGKLVVSAEYESRFETARTTLRSIEVVGGTPRVVLTSEDRTLHSTSLRTGAEYRMADILLLRLGFDRIGEGDTSQIIPTAGFSVEQNLGDLGASFQYVFGKEPYSLGSFHVIGVQLNI